MTKPIIGFIGLGLMGGNMVENLQKRGFDLVVMDLNKDAVADGSRPRQRQRGQPRPRNWPRQATSSCCA